MVGTIGPLVKVAAGRWAVGALLHAAGGIAGGALLGLFLGGFGASARAAFRVESDWMDAPLVLVGVIVLARDIGILHLEGPSFRRSVPKSWFYVLGPSRANLVYGMVLGLGVTTTVPVASYYWLLMWVLATADPAFGALILGAYGLGRTLPVLVTAPFIARGCSIETVLVWIQAHRPVLKTAAAAGVALWLIHTVVV